MTPLDCAKLAKAAYEKNRDKARAEIWSIAPGANLKFIDVERADVEGFVFRDHDTVVVCFAGTESWMDLVRDAWFVPGAYYVGNEKMIIHSGFARAIRQVGPQVSRALRDLYFFDPGRMKHIPRVIGIGHSLGASIVLGTLDKLWYQFQEINGRTEAVTFGRPNGWSKSAIQAHESRHRTVNYVNPWDYVTKLLGWTTGSPGMDVQLSGRRGHVMNKYIENLEAQDEKNIVTGNAHGHGADRLHPSKLQK